MAVITSTRPPFTRPISAINVALMGIDGATAADRDKHKKKHARSPQTQTHTHTQVFVRVQSRCCWVKKKTDIYQVVLSHKLCRE